MRILISNLSTYANERQVRDLFSLHGEVSSVTIVYDKFSNRSRGFGYVEMAVHEAGEKAISKLNNTLFMDKKIQVGGVGHTGMAGFGKK